MRLHSTVDVVTNSSGTIFTWILPDGIKNFKLGINTILQKAGSSKTADDLFNFETTINSDIRGDLQLDWDCLEPEEKLDDYDNDFERYIRENTPDENSSEGDRRELVITMKDGSELPKNFLYLFDPFDREAGWC